ncbi:DUF814 domain-containing protein, partial [bacterium]|nr:DUF814 domain-containing protein [bacterium]
DDLPWAVGRFYAAQVAEMEVKGLRERLDRALSRESKRVTKYRDKLEREFRELPDPDGTQNLGDHLAANLHLVRQGASEVTVADLYGGEPVTVPLDPALSPSKNLDRFYRRARRDRRKIEGLRRRIDEMTEREWWLDERREALAAAGDDTEALRALESKLTDDGLLTAPKPKQVISGKKKAAQVPSGPRRFTAKDGSEILVGRTSTENDELTFRIGRGNDLWLHAAGAAGSHVVVRSAKGREVDHETLLDAATLAVHYSKVSRQESGEVKYTPCKNVRKPKGAPPGKVIASPAKTIFVRVEPDRLARLQASRASSGINDG